MAKRYDGSRIAWDLGNYLVRYDELDISYYSNAEFGYYVISRMSQLCGLSFEQFYMVVTFIIISCVFYRAYKLGSSIHGLSFAYMIYFILCPMDQLRNQLAYIILLSIFPLDFSSRKAIFKNYITVALSTFFHISFFLYFIPLTFARIKSTRLIKYFPYLIVGMTIIMMATGNISVIREAIEIINSSSDYMTERYGKYAATNVSLSYLAPATIYLTFIYGLNKWRQNSSLKRITDTQISDTIRFCFFCGFFIPPLVINATMYRITRDVSLISIMLMTTNEKAKNQKLLALIILSMSLGWFVFDIFAKGYWEDYLSNFLNNAFFNF